MVFGLMVLARSQTVICEDHQNFKTDHLNIQDNFDPLPTDL